MPDREPRAPVLNGWKEIAAYLGKSVRAVQRWEQHSGLPVHRIRTSTGQIIYAYPSEIDEWRRAHERASAMDATSRDERPAIQKFSARFAAVVSIVGLAIGITAAIALIGIRGRPVAADFSLRGDTLEAATTDGAIVWRHPFNRPLGQLQHSEGPAISEVDIDNDGVAEILVKVHFVPTAGQSDHTEVLYCFSRTGEVRWRYEPSLTVVLGGREFSGPWRLYDMMMSSGTETRYTWLAFGDSTWWPSALVRIGPDGAASVRYIQSGAIYALEELRRPDGAFIVAGGVDNEFRMASVALIPVEGNGPPLVSPQTPGGAYHCGSCSPGGPTMFALLPRTELNALGGLPYNRVDTLSRSRTHISVGTHEYGYAGALFVMDQNLRVIETAFTDGFTSEHDRMLRAKAVAHTVDVCPRWAGEAMVRRWTPEHGWESTPVPR